MVGEKTRYKIVAKEKRKLKYILHILYTFYITYIINKLICKWICRYIIKYSIHKQFLKLRHLLTLKETLDSVKIERFLETIVC